MNRIWLLPLMLLAACSAHAKPYIAGNGTVTIVVRSNGTPFLLQYYYWTRPGGGIIESDYDLKSLGHDQYAVSSGSLHCGIARIWKIADDLIGITYNRNHKQRLLAFSETDLKKVLDASRAESAELAREVPRTSFDWNPSGAILPKCT